MDPHIMTNFQQELGRARQSNMSLKLKQRVTVIGVIYY